MSTTTTGTDGRKWTYRVVKRARGSQGEFFDFPTAATFGSESAAQAYAARFAAEQADVGGAEIDVRCRRGNRTVTTWKLGGAPRRIDWSR